jgi:hypothetical protein
VVPQSTSGRKGHSVSSVRRSDDPSDARPFRVPEDDPPVLAAACENLAVERPGDRPDIIAVALELPELHPSANIPQPNAVVVLEVVLEPPFAYASAADLGDEPGGDVGGGGLLLAEVLEGLTAARSEHGAVRREAHAGVLGTVALELLELPPRANIPQPNAVVSAIP